MEIWKKISKIRNSTQPEIAYYPDGKVRSKSFCIDGVSCGSHFKWRENGGKSWQTMFKGTKQHGLDSIWREDGSKWYEEMWRDGKEHGVSTNWNKDGRKSSQGIRTDGRKHGVSTGWWNDGTKKKEIYHIRGEVYARMEWDEGGNAIQVKFPTHPKGAHSYSHLNPLSYLKSK